MKNFAVTNHFSGEVVKVESKSGRSAVTAVFGPMPRIGRNTFGTYQGITSEKPRKVTVRRCE